MGDELLGCPLPLALAKLEERGVTPTVTRLLAPRRDAAQGEWRVVRVRQGGAALDVCAFVRQVLPDDQGTASR